MLYALTFQKDEFCAFVFLPKHVECICAFVFPPTCVECLVFPPVGLLNYCRRRHSPFDRIPLKHVSKRNWRDQCVWETVLLVHVTTWIRYILLARSTAKIYWPNIISVSNLSSETHMDAVDYLVVYFISEGTAESKLTKTRLFYVDSKPTCAIRINFETTIRSLRFSYLVT